MTKKELDKLISNSLNRLIETRISNGLNESSYEASELDKLNYSSEFPIKVLFVDGDGNKTKFLSLTPKTIPTIIKYLKDITDFVPDPDWKVKNK